MKHRVSAAVAVLLLAAGTAVAVWMLFARPDAGSAISQAPGGRSAAETPTAPPTPAFTVPKKRVDPLKGASYCATAKLLGVYAHQSYGLDPGLGVVSGRQFSKRLDVVAATYRRLATQAERSPDVGAKAPRAWRTLAATVEAAERKLRVTGYDVQSQVMILELAKVAKATQRHLPTATATLTATCGVTRESIGL